MRERERQTAKAQGLFLLGSFHSVERTLAYAGRGVRALDRLCSRGLKDTICIAKLSNTV